MQQIRRVDAFAREAQAHLPGVLYSFNIADLKRRNGHLGFDEGDKDIVELSQALSALVSDTAIVAHVEGDRWLMFSETSEHARVQALLDAYRKSDPITAGWQIEASRNGRQRSDSLGVTTTIARGVRCLYCDVHSPGDLAHAMKAIAENDHSLPVDRPIALGEVPAMVRESWSCIAEYPADRPICPFCAGHEFAWEDGDGDIYMGYGRCEACDADIAITSL
jgi:GGDEF domain-containing protein